MQRIDSLSSPAAPAEGWRALLSGAFGLYALMLNLGFALHAMDVFLVSTIMPNIVADLGGARFYSWTTMLYMVASILGAAASAPLAARFGGKTGYAVGIWLFLVGSLLCAASPSMAVLLLARTVQGFGGGMMLSRGMALVGELFPESLRKPVLASISSTWGIAALCGPALAGSFAALDFWRGAFWINLPLGLFFLLLVQRHLKSQAPKPATAGALFPFPQMALLTLGVFCVALAGEWQAIELRLLSIAASLPVLAAALAVDATSLNRLFPTRPLSLSTPTGASYWIMFLASMTHTAIGLFLPLALQRLHGFNALEAGYATAALALGWTVVAIVTTRWHGRAADAAMIGGQAAALLGTFLLLIGIEHIPVAAIVALNALVGIGLGGANLHLTAAAMRLARPGEEAITAASMPMIRSLGIAFGAALAGTIATAAGLTDSLLPADVAHAIFWVFAFACLLPLTTLAINCRFLQLARRVR